MHSLVVSRDGGVWSWGTASHGRLGYPADKSMPVDERYNQQYQPCPRRVDKLGEVKIVQGAGAASSEKTYSPAGDYSQLGLVAAARLNWDSCCFAIVLLLLL